ncbi:MAG: cob(I)yrinic acid a,c-diamide adenosyltransferase [Vallitaleaceae bacterium]|nr:cob(I)yrinic acid a,c-diamide adenosyltransferase [Vallitaleaceae bacterium]
MEKGYIQIYTGYGKGKTTAALGLGFRAVGNGLRVMMIQFLKSAHSSEQESIKAFKDVFEIKRLAVHEKFFWQLSAEEKADFRIKLQKELYQIDEILLSGLWDVVILDEIFGALSNGMVTEEQLEKMLHLKPESVELVLTGRDAPERFIEMADLVTEMKPIKHYYEKGVKSRKGIEY